MFFDDVLRLQKELDYLFGNSFDTHSTFSRGLFPAINLFEKEDGIVLKAELPSVKKEDINIELEGDALTISGERKGEPEHDVVYHRKERTNGTFRRKIKLPYRVDSERVMASLENGVLTVELEKDARDRARKITIR